MTIFNRYIQVNCLLIKIVIVKSKILSEKKIFLSQKMKILVTIISVVTIAFLKKENVITINLNNSVN